MNRSFVDAIGYVERNEKMWSEMIHTCWLEWVGDNAIHMTPYSSFSNTDDFKRYVLSTYGIQCFMNDNTDAWDYRVIDYVKYSLFQIKYSR